MQTFCWYLHGTLLLLRNEKSAFMEFILNNHYQIVYRYFFVFQLVLTNCFSIFGLRLGARRIFDPRLKLWKKNFYNNK